MITRDISNAFRLNDWTQELNVIPNQWGTITNSGLFVEESVAENTVVFEEIIKDGALIVDRVRGERNSVNKDYTRKLHSFVIPHFPDDDAILPSDLQGVRAYGSPDQADQLANVRARKMERIRQDHAWTLEKARAQVLTAGTVYAPNGTVTQNWFTEFGVTQTTIDFVFGTGTTEILDKIDQVIYNIQTNAGNGGVISGVVGFASRTFFSNLIKHPTVKAAYQYYKDGVQPLRERLGGNTTMHREFEYGGVRFIEMNDTYAGSALIPAGDCVFVPTGTDAFRTYFAPAQKFGLVNTLGEQVYMFEYESPRGDKIEIETESNFVNACLRPAVIIRGYSSN